MRMGYIVGFFVYWVCSRVGICLKNGDYSNGKTIVEFSL